MSSLFPRDPRPALFLAGLVSAAVSTAAATERPEPLGPAPAIELTLHDGTTLNLAEAARDGLVFVYFYPKDDTPGCTVEAQGIRDRYEAFRAAGVRVIGVSLQNASSHQAFIDKYELPFPLAVDDGSVAAAFGVPVRGEYASRQSFLLKDGKIVKAWRQVNPSGHAEAVLAAVASLDK